MTPEQLQLLEAAIMAETNATFVAFRTANNEVGMADWYNAPSGDLLWQTAVPVKNIHDAIDYSAYTLNGTIDGTAVQTNRLLAAQTKQINIQIMLQGLQTFDATPNRARTALLDATTSLPTGVNGALTSASGTDGVRVVNALTRSATRGERLYSSQTAFVTGTVSAYKAGTFQGNIGPQDIADALRL